MFQRFRKILRSHLWWGLAFLPILVPAYLVRFKLGPLPTTALEIILGIFFVLFTAAHGRAGWAEGARRLGAFRIPVLVWCLASFAAALWAPDAIQGLGLWRAYVLEPVLLLVVLTHEFQDPHRRGFLRLSTYALVWAMAAWGLFQYLTGIGIPAPWNVALGAGRRATGPFPFPNALALLTAPIGAYAFARFVKAPGNALSLLTFGAALLSALVARSDGAALALVAVATLLLLLERRFRLIGVGLILVGVISLAALPAIRGEVWQEVSFQSWSGRVRVWMWDETLQMLRDRPLTGAGLGGYPTVVAPYHGHDFIEIFQYPHSLILNFWSETGLLGLIAFVWILVTWLREGKRLGGEAWTGALAVTGVLFIHGLVDVPYFKNDLAVMFFVLLILTVIRLDQEPKRG
ncbi:O-antigen ligase family protein [Patescibacteria group bacterium]|jgi:O-antigen ligase|nr:O-antigen ligase family protein [Patescibacteria group bacterium]